MTTAHIDVAVHTTDGLAILGPAATRTKNQLQRVFTLWADTVDAHEWDFSPLLCRSDLERFDYFANFPHLAVEATTAQPDVQQRRYISSAACYSAYAALADTELIANTRLTLTQRCCRTESHYRGLERLHAFTMREIVALGDPDFTRQHLAQHKAKVGRFAADLGITTTVENAIDPFFDPEGSRAVTQRLLPVKQELLTDDGVAIASFNYHRNFFGERAGISINGEPATTSCVAFGLERWLHALHRAFDGDWDEASAAVARQHSAERERVLADEEALA